MTERHPPFIQGQLAADAGFPYTACPFDKPDRPAQGEHYPGPWVNWMSGWINRRSMKVKHDDPDLVAACELAQAVTWPWPGRKPGEPL
ncbi:MAG: hypothetical protein JXQ79_10210 [Rhodobacteraceae bacterium]|nr:hypothetical protein [Paracoccaceae bacterium]